MRPVYTTAGPNTGPNTMLERMRRHGISSIFVVDRSRRLLGLVHAADAARAVRTGEALDEYMQREVITVQEDTPMAEVIRLGANISVPIAVCDREGRLQGVIVKGAILATLAQSNDSPAAGSAPSA